MALPDADRDNPAEGIKIPASVFIEHVLTFPPTIINGRL
jgi:hypothetical protein